MASEYFLEPEINLVTENTENILSEGMWGHLGTRQQDHSQVVESWEGAGLGKGWGPSEGGEA